MLLDKNRVNMSVLVTSAIYGMLSDLFYLLFGATLFLCLTFRKVGVNFKYLQKCFYSVWPISSRSIITSFPKGWRELMPNCSQNTAVVGTPLTTLLAALLAHSRGSAVNPVICQKVMLNLYEMSYFWPLLLLFKCLVLSPVRYRVVHCAGRTGLPGACEMYGFVTHVDSRCVRMGSPWACFSLLRNEREAHILHLQNFKERELYTASWNLY